MADQPTVGDKLPVAATGVAVEPNLLDTTIAKDSNLQINVSAPTAPVSTVASAAPVVTAPEVPILVTESEILPTQTNSSSLAEEIESLSGEIQALEAKIDRLTGGVKPVIDSSTEVSAKVEPPNVDSQTVMPAKEEIVPPPPAGDEEKLAERVANRPTSRSIPTPTLTSPRAESNKPEAKGVGINDIYSKVAQRQKEADAPTSPGFDDAEDVGSGSTVGTIGEVLGVLGIIIFLIMVAFPFYKSMLPENVTEAIRSIGLPTAVISLALGFLVSLIGHGQRTIKILPVIIWLLAVSLYLAVEGFQSYLGPLGPMLEPIFSFYG